MNKKHLAPHRAALSLPAAAWTILLVGAGWPVDADGSSMAAEKPNVKRPAAEHDRAPAEPPVHSATVEREARAIEGLLVAPCCYKGTLTDHASGVADQMRAEIRQMLAAGKARPEILAYYRKQYGQAVLAEPPRSGFSGLVLYGIPFGLATVGLLVMTLLVARRRGDEAAGQAEALPEDHPIPPALQQRIDALVAGGDAPAAGQRSGPEGARGVPWA